mgnify:CR=1 FL=1
MTVPDFIKERHSISVLDVLKILVPASAIYVLYTLYVVNEQVQVLAENLRSLHKEIQTLKQENTDLKELILEKNTTITELLEEKTAYAANSSN